MFEYSTFLDYVEGYKHNHEGESPFLDSYCSAIDDFKKAVNPKDEEEIRGVKDLLQSALTKARKCREINDDFSHWINPEGLIEAIEQNLQKQAQ